MKKQIRKATFDELQRQAEMDGEGEVRQDGDQLATEEPTGGQAIMSVVAGPTAGRT